MTHTIHGIGIFTYIKNPLKSTIHVDKCTSPMDGMGERMKLRNLFWGGEGGVDPGPLQGVNLPSRIGFLQEGTPKGGRLVA